MGHVIPKCFSCDETTSGRGGAARQFNLKYSLSKTNIKKNPKMYALKTYFTTYYRTFTVST